MPASRSNLKTLVVAGDTSSLRSAGRSRRVLHEGSRYEVFRVLTRLDRSVDPGDPKLARLSARSKALWKDIAISGLLCVEAAGKNASVEDYGVFIEPARQLAKTLYIEGVTGARQNGPWLRKSRAGSRNCTSKLIGFSQAADLHRYPSSSRCRLPVALRPTSSSSIGHCLWFCLLRCGSSSAPRQARLSTSRNASLLKASASCSYCRSRKQSARPTKPVASGGNAVGTRCQGSPALIKQVDGVDGHRHVQLMPA